MTDSFTNHQGITYATTGPIKIAQLATDFNPGDVIGLVCTEMDMSTSGAYTYDVIGTRLIDRAMPPRAIQYRVVNLTTCGLATTDERVDVIQGVGVTGDDRNVNPYHPLLGIKQSQLRNGYTSASSGQTIPHMSIPYTRRLGIVKDVLTTRPTQEQVDAAHIDPLAYKKLYEQHRMEILLYRPTATVVAHDEGRRQIQIEEQRKDPLSGY
jgi:hypothetical protein